MKKNKIRVKFSSKRLRSIDSTKLAAKKIRDVFLAMDFNLQDKLCDTEDLRNSWE